MRDIIATIISNREVADSTCLLELECKLGTYTPGQFVMVRLGETMDPFLRRPLGILSSNGSRLSLLYRINGRGTRLLSDMGEGRLVAILGPLGKGFVSFDKNDAPLFVGGGTGLPPVFSMAEHLSKGRLITGARSASAIYIPKIRIPSLIATEDGSMGTKGMVTDLIKGTISSIYACGPYPMLRAVAMIALDRGIPCQVSLEARMGCGFGVCAGCAVETITGTKRVCLDGPVFDAADIIWKDQDPDKGF